MTDKKIKTATELLKEVDEEDRRVLELRKIRKKRNNFKAKEKLQKRKVEVIEYEDGTYSLIGFAWDLPLKSDEVSDAFENWLDGSLENGTEIKVI